VKKGKDDGIKQDRHAGEAQNQEFLGADLNSKERIPLSFSEGPMVEMSSRRKKKSSMVGQMALMVKKLILVGEKVGVKGRRGDILKEDQSSSQPPG